MVNNFINNGYIGKEEQLFFLGTQQIPGVQNLNLSYTNNSTLIKHLGMTGCQYVPNGIPSASVDISSLLISNDQFISYTGDQGVNGFILKNRGDINNNIAFTSGYLTSYACQCSIGQIPQINSSFVILGDVGKIPITTYPVLYNQLTGVQSGWSTLTLKIADPGSIDLSVNSFVTNRVQDFNVNVNVPRNPIYALGSRFPNKVEINYPIECAVSFNIEVNDYSFKKVTDYPFNDTKDNITINIKDLDTQQNIVSYAFSGMSLYSENYTAGVDGNVRATLNYRGYYGR